MEAPHDTGNWLDQCGSLHRHVFGVGIDHAFGNCHVFRKSPGVVCDTNRFPALTEISHSALAVIAGAAVQGGINSDAIADRNSLDVLTDPRHFATEFVTD